MWKLARDICEQLGVGAFFHAKNFEQAIEAFNARPSNVIFANAEGAPGAKLMTNQSVKTIIEGFRDATGYRNLIIGVAFEKSSGIRDEMRRNGLDEPLSELNVNSLKSVLKVASSAFAAPLGASNKSQPPPMPTLPFAFP